MANALDIPEQEHKTDDKNDDFSKCDDLDKLIDLIQAKIAIPSQNEKIKLVTLAPENWPIKKVIKKLNITEYKVKKKQEH